MANLTPVIKPARKAISRVQRIGSARAGTAKVITVECQRAVALGKDRIGLLRNCTHVTHQARHEGQCSR